MRGCLQNTKLLVLAVFTGSLVLAACGQKGPLYLPENKAQVTKAKEESTAPSGDQSEAVEDNTGKQGKSGEIPK